MSMEEPEVFAVQKIPRSTTGEYTYVVTIFFECPVIRKIEEGKTEAKAEIKLSIPGVLERAPSMPVEYKAFLYLNEKEWQKCQKKFIVGKKVQLKIGTDGSIKIG